MDLPLNFDPTNTGVLIAALWVQYKALTYKITELCKRVERLENMHLKTNGGTTDARVR